MSYWNCLSLEYATEDLFIRVAGITMIAALFELLPLADDNYTVPLSAAVLTMLLLP
jgi:dolichol kinase